MQGKWIVPYTGCQEQRRIEAILRERNVFAFWNFEGSTSEALYSTEQFVSHYRSGGAQVRCLLDRNIVSPLVRAAEGGILDIGDPTVIVACALMAFSAAAGIDLEPALALYEVAQKTSHEIACRELERFRIAESVPPSAFEHVALGRMDRIPRTLLSEAHGRARHDTVSSGAFEEQLREWKRHRLPLTKLAVLLRQGPGIDAMIELLRWSKEEAYFDGMVLVLGTVVLSPRNNTRALRGIQSPDPRRCLAVVDNVAWDLTYVTQANRWGTAEHWLMCTADGPLRELVQIGLGRGGSASELLYRYWDPADASRLSGLHAEIEKSLPRVFAEADEERGSRLEALRGELVRKIVGESRKGEGLL